MTTRIELADAIAVFLTSRQINAVVDVRNVAANTPCVLIPPPAVAFAAAPPGGEPTWRLLLIAADGSGSRAAWEQLDRLLDAVDSALPIERADPTTFVNPGGGDPLPAYAVTLIGGSTQ